MRPRRWLTISGGEGVSIKVDDILIFPFFSYSSLRPNLTNLVMIRSLCNSISYHVWYMKLDELRSNVKEPS